MDRERLDPEGFIVAEADLSNVQPEYKDVPRAAADLLLREFGSRLHSGYIYGSVVRGNAVARRSDVDLVAVLRAPVTGEDRGSARVVARGLEERFPVLSSAGVELTHLHEVLSREERYGWQVFLRELSVCICGEDLRPRLPRTKPGAAVAAGFHRDTHSALARARNELGGSTDPAVVQRACRVASRRMVQAAFAVVMAREGVWGDSAGGAGRPGGEGVPAVG